MRRRVEVRNSCVKYPVEFSWIYLRDLLWREDWGEEARRSGVGIWESRGGGLLLSLVGWVGVGWVR